MDKRPSSNTQFSCCHCSVKILSTEKMPVHPLHEPVQHITCSMCIGMIIGNFIVSNILTQLYDLEIAEKSDLKAYAFLHISMSLYFRIFIQEYFWYH